MWTFGYGAQPSLLSYSSAAALEPTSGKSCIIAIGESHMQSRPSNEATDSAVVRTETSSLVTADHYILTRLGKAIKTELSLTNMYWLHHAVAGTKIITFGRGGTAYKALEDKENYHSASIVAPHAAFFFQGTNNVEDSYWQDWHVAFTYLVDQLRQRWGDIPIFMFQVKGSRDATQNLKHARIGDVQAKLDHNSGHAYSLDKVYVIPSHHCPLTTADNVHMNEDAGDILADSSFAYWDYICNSSGVNVLAPRLTNISHSSGTVTLTFSSSITDHTNYDFFFRVYDDGVAATISSMGRKSGDDTSIELVLSSTPSGTITVTGCCSDDSTIDMGSERLNVPKDATSGTPVLMFYERGLGAQ